MLFATKATSVLRLSASLPLKGRTMIAMPPLQVNGIVSVFLRFNSNHTANPKMTTTNNGDVNDDQIKHERVRHTLAAKEKFIKLNPRQRIFTIPNILTMCRIASTPVIGYFIWNGMNHQALMCFAFAAATDLFDGIIARKFNQYTDLGAILDPIADKLLLMTCFISMYNVGLMPLWLIKGYVMRDLALLIGGGVIRYYGFGERPTIRKYFDFQNHPTLGFEPTYASKCNTAIQCALICYHLGFGFDPESWPLYGVHMGSALLASTTLAQYYFRAKTPNLFQSVKTPKGWNTQVKSR